MTSITEFSSMNHYKIIFVFLSIISVLGYFDIISGFLVTPSLNKINMFGGLSVRNAVTTKSTTTVAEGNEIRGPITVLGDYILVYPKCDSRYSPCQIIYPDEIKEQSTEAEVIAVGPGRLHPYTGIRINNPVTVGMSIIYGVFDGIELKYNNENMHVIRAEDVMLFYHGSHMTKHNVEPSRDYILVKPDKKVTQTDSGILFSASAIKKEDKKPNIGIVFKVGKGRVCSTGKIIESPVRVGQKVNFKPYSGIELKIEDDEWLLVKMIDILCSSTS